MGTATPAVSGAGKEELAAGSAAAPALVHMAAAANTGGEAGAGESDCDCAAWSTGSSAGGAGACAGSVFWTEPSKPVTAELSHRSGCPSFRANSGEDVSLLSVAVSD
jgi:hypothetical protein